MSQPNPMRRRSMQYPAAQPVFSKIDRRHRPDQNVVQSDCNGGGYLVAAKRPGDREGEERFKRIQRGKSKKNADGGAESDRMRRVRHRHKGHVMVG